MGIGNKRPPLPAPTDDPTDESVVQAGHMDSMDSGTDVATNVSRRTDATSYTVPEDGRPLIIPTEKRAQLLSHGRNKSQTSLLIEYFEGSKNGTNGSRPSVRVKVTPSSKRRNKAGQSDAVQITGIGKDRKPSYTRRISLGSKQTDREGNAHPIEGTEMSHSSESNLSGRPPVEVEILNHGSDLSNNNPRLSRDLQYMTNPSDISSMPPESLLDDNSRMSERPHSPLIVEQETKAVIDEHLQAPDARERSRSISRERITQKVMEKLKQRSEKPVEYEPDNKPTKERRIRSSRTHHGEDSVTNTESSVVSSSLTPSQTSYRSGATSKVSLNNPKLLEMVEETVRRLILPEIDQLKNEERTRRNLRDLDDNRRESCGESRDSYSEDMSRRLSKSSSSPNISSKPKVVLNRYDDNPGEVLSRGDSERKKSRRSSRESVPRSEHSERRSSKTERERSVTEEGKESHRLRDAAAAGVAGGILTAAALRHHDSRDGESREKRRKRRSSKSHGSRSRSASVAENNEEVYRKEDIPPMPFASAINESDVTRTSILSHATERPASRHSEDTHTPVREVSRGSLGDGTLPGSRTPTQNVTHEPMSPSTPRSISNKARIAALAAAGLGGVEVQKKVEDEHLAETYKTPHSRSLASPAHSVSSVKDDMRDPLIPQGLRPRSRHSYASPIDNKRHSVQSDESTREAEHELEDHLPPISENTYDDPGTPQGEDMEEWFQKQHEENERYRHSLAGSSVLDSVDERRQTHYTEDTYSSGNTSPDRDVRGVGTQPQYVHTPHGVESAVASLLEPSMVSSSVRSSTNTGRSEDAQYQDRTNESLRDLDQGSPAPHRIEAIEKAEEEPPSPVKSHWSAIREQAALLSEKNSPDASGPLSPRQSETTFPIQMGSSGLPLAHDPMPEIGHGLDNVSEVSTNPPEIQGPKGKGRRERWSYDSEGFLKDRQSRDSISQKSGHGGKDALLGAGLGATAGALAAEHAHAGKYQGTSSRDISHRPSVVDDYNRGPTPGVHEAEAVYMDRPGANSPAGVHGDEGYSSAAHPRSPGGIIAKGGSGREFTKKQLAEYEAAMGPDDDMSFGVGKKHARHFSANSHGLASPPYDSATGKGIDRIQSEDIVALMDHLTVRDGQRNARDTEILVTLVRSAAEMRQEFEAMKKFIAEQDKMIMRNTDRDAELTVQKVLSGPRPMPGGAITPARGPRTSYDSEETYAPKQNSFWKRALKGFGSGKNKDEVKVMLKHLLDEIEVMKSEQVIVNRPPMSLRTDSMDSYDDRRAGPDSGYEPEGQAGTGSTPNESGHLSLTPTREKHFHSGYDGRRGSMNRVSTVMEEGDEDDSYLDPDEAALLDNQFEGNERLTTPTQENFKRLSGGYGTPPRGHGAFAGNRELTPEQQTPEKQRKHKSNSSSLFGIPKLSRWSKTTSSSDPDYKRKSNQSYQSYQSRASRSGDSLDRDDYYDDSYSLKSDNRLRSSQSLAREEEGRERRTRSDRSSTLTRTPSPLVPSDNGAPHHDHGKEPLMSGGAGGPSPVNELRRENLQQFDDDEAMDAASFDDPKYQAHRNSLLLEHPQPRPGPTHRHQTNLENEARTFSGEMNVPSGLTNSDLSSKTADSDFDPAQWGSNPTLSLARTNKIAASGAKDEGPLIPQVQPSARQQQNEREDAEAARRRELEREEERQSKQPRHAYDRMYYSSPLGSGHLLEPIPEVRYSLETNSIHSLRSEGRSPEPSARPSVATNGAAQAPSPARKITGPRPMGSRNASREEKAVEESARNGTVRRKPVAGGRGHVEEEESGWGTWKGGRQH